MRNSNRFVEKHGKRFSLLEVFRIYDEEPYYVGNEGNKDSNVFKSVTDPLCKTEIFTKLSNFTCSSVVKHPYSKSLSTIPVISAVLPFFLIK